MGCSIRFIKQQIARASHYFRVWIAESPSTRDFHLIWYQFRTRGFRAVLMKDLYNDLFFEEYSDLGKYYKELSNLIYDWAQPESACDFGCGNGFLLSFLSEKGVQITGVDGSLTALKFVEPAVGPRLLIRDLSIEQFVGLFDLVISTEVAEHLPKIRSRIFVQNLARAARKNIVFSAAKPGQWGDGHINCQPREFWLKLFGKENWFYDEDATIELQSSLRRSPGIMENLPWVDNLLLLVPRGKSDHAPFM